MRISMAGSRLEEIINEVSLGDSNPTSLAPSNIIPPPKKKEEGKKGQSYCTYNSNVEEGISAGIISHY